MSRCQSRAIQEIEDGAKDITQRPLCGTEANIAEQDQTPQDAASYQGFR